ncbi:MAG TPA: MCP four helix bundle domain-containing protein [Candidatus Coprenecus stercoravium]|uniref:MCP four helix bundle domain-containing protein n=1 Tax=Candidatus Coprenecus stercoravium TaxID=2840735 RepID=A0A9D2GQ42_9BACT|nr:MCP four helix bundle domain-containing protein [Candidatus Coprenecus stercoravium]
MSKFKKIKLGVRSKIYLASMVVGLMLLLSGVMAFFEFGRMSRYISDLISNSILSVDLTRNLINACDRYHSDLFRQIGEEGLPAQPDVIPAEEFESGIDKLYSVISSDEERRMADSVRYAYSAYMQVSLEVGAVWLKSQEERTDWYFNRLQKVYEKFRTYLQRLSDSSQAALTDSYDSLQDSYYRSIMPGVVANAASIVLVVLFNYFLVHYLVRPVVRMSGGLRDYRRSGKPYSVSFDYGGDQIQSMNEDIKEIIDENKSHKKS